MPDLAPKVLFRQNLIKSIALVILVSFLLFLSNFQFISIVAMTMLLIMTILFYRDKILRNIKNNKPAILIISFYLLHLISLIYSQNLKYALFDLQVKLSFIIMPIIFAGIYLDSARRD